LIDRVLGSARIVEKIGVGGMATVYKGYQFSLDRFVAVKVLSRDVQREEFLTRFQREAQAVAKLRHPNVLSIYDFGQEEDLAYIIMDYISGGTLADLIRNGMSLKRAIEIAIQVGDALHYAHEREIVHRDVKPANILIDTSGRPLLTDFGLVKFLVPSDHSLTQPDTSMGTPAYMAPEQATNGGEVDARSDIYALGTVLYEMVTGYLPFEAGNDIRVMIFKKLSEPPPSPRQFEPSVPADVEQVILKALAPEPENRYQNASEMTQALRSVINGLS
jgi:serine/threonine protein kinase